MKALLLTAAAVLMALGSISVSVNAQSTGPTKASTVTTAKGALDVYQPGKTLVLKDVNGVTTSYTYGEEVVYVDPAGKVLSTDQVKARMRAGLPIRLEFVPQGDARVIRRVIIEEAVVGD